MSRTIQREKLVDYLLFNHSLKSEHIKTMWTLVDQVINLHHDPTEPELAVILNESLWKIKAAIKALDQVGLIKIERRRVDLACVKTQNFYSFPGGFLESLEVKNLDFEKQNVETSRRNAFASANANAIKIHREVDEVETSELQRDQMTLIIDDNLQHLGALDIQAQHNLARLGINPNLRQKFKKSPALIKKYTPSQILYFHDPDGRIAANLAAWRAAIDAGAEPKFGGKEMGPVLMWTRIVELQPPPEPPAEPEFLELPAVEPEPELVQMTPAEQKWNATLELLRRQMTRDTFKSTLLNTLVVELSKDDTLTVQAPSELALDWLQNRMYKTVQQAASRNFGREVRLEFCV